MIEHPLVSVVIPSYNRAQFIERTILSGLDQTYSDIELVIIDGASTDETVDILKSYGDRIRWISENDKGEADAYNKGLSLCAGQIICFLPSDDILLPDAVETAIQMFRNSEKDVALVNGDALIIDEHDHIIGFTRGAQFSKHYLVNICPGRVIQPATFIKKIAIEQVGGWDVKIKYASDLDLFIRLHTHFESQYIQKPMACVRRHSDSLTVSDTKYVLMDQYRTRRRYGGKFLSPASYRELRGLVRAVLRREV